MPWQKGESGNPNGRPKKDESISNIVKEIGEIKRARRINGKKRMVSQLRIAVQKAYDLAMSGDVAAMKFLADRRDGKMPTTIELQGPDGTPLFNYDSKLDDIK